MSILCCPAAGTMQIAGAGGIHEDQPGNAAVVHLPHFPYFLCPGEGRLIAKIQCRHFCHMGIGLIQEPVYIMHPFIIRILNHVPDHIIDLCAKMSSHDLLCQIYNIKKPLYPVFLQALKCCIYCKGKRLSLCCIL